MDAHHCSRCRKPLPPDAAQTYGRLCPRCVLAVLAAPVSHPPDAPTEIAGPPDPSDPTLQEPRFQPGDTFGPYRIGRLLGRGGMGEVYEAEHSDQGRRIALKVLNQRLRRADDRTRFLQEGRLAASINHPNSVYIFGSEEIDGIPVIGMELLPGGTLKGRVNAKGTLPVAEAVDAILQVIAGLDAAHAAGVLHRDIKPSNCFIDHDGIVKVGDFGLSISTLSRPVS
jgi:serine/threonine protein kinase